MTRKQILLLTFFLPTISFGQDTTTTKNRRFFIGVNFSPDYCYRNIAKNDNSISSDQWAHIKNILDSIYIPNFGYTTGLNFYYQIKKRLSIETGIQYSRKGYKTIALPTIYDFNYDPVIATNYFYFTYLDFPFRANFTFSKSKFQIIASAGAVLNYLLQVSGKTVPENRIAIFEIQTYGNQFAYNNINISPTVSLGLKYNINNRLNLRAEPTFRYGLRNTDSKSFVFTRLWTAGLNISFNYGL
jgi:hypothetical protein